MKTSLRHKKLYEVLHDQIMRGQFAFGDRLPSERDLTTKFSVSRITVMRALNDLQQDGLIWRKQGAGSFVKTVAASEGRRLGLMIPGISHSQAASVFPTIQHQILRHAAQLGWQVLPGDAEMPSEADCSGRMPVEVARRLVAHGITSVAFSPLPINSRFGAYNHNVLSEFRAARVPVVLIGGDVVDHPDRSDYDVVALDDEYAGYLLGQHLLARGCRNIAFVGLSVHFPAHALRLAGLRAAVLQGGNARIREISLQRRPADRRAILATIRKETCDALVGENDEVAALVMRYLLDAGIKVPGQVKLAGFDNAPIAGLLPVPLTSVAQPTEGLAIEIMAALQERMKTPDLPGRWIRLHGRLVKRKSTKD